MMIRIFVTSVMLFFTIICRADNFNKIDGLWQASYAKSGTPSSHIQITTLPNGEVVGIIKEAYPRPGEHPSPNCVACTDPEFKDKPIVGMRVLWGMKYDGDNVWSGGKVLDPETGKIYSGKMTLSKDANSINLRGFVLITALGETTTWKRLQ